MHVDTTSLKIATLAAGSPAARGFIALLLVASAIAGAPAAVADTANWTTTNHDIWMYANAPSGTRATMPTFAGGLELDETSGQFLPSDNTHAARQGTALLGFNTAGIIAPGLSPHHYQIQSVTLTVGLEPSGAEPLLYRRTPVTNAEILENVANSEIDTAMPFELYGVGFRSGYTGFGFGPFAAGPPLLEENSSPFGSDGYVAYPIASNSSHCCGYVDVSNSLTGGFSATAPGNTTAPFDPVPWAIGESDMNAGDVIADDDEFTFSLDLSSLAVRQYVQAALAKGELGFFLSSWHLTGEFGAGGAYPSWYSKQAPLGGDVPPRLEIQYAIVEPVAGDYDGDQDVDGSDFLLWQRSLGSQVTPGLGADGSGNGHVDAADLPVWSQGFGGGSPPSPIVNGVPEPAAATLCLMTAMVVSCAGSRRARSSTSENR